MILAPEQASNPLRLHFDPQQILSTDNLSRYPNKLGQQVSQAFCCTSIAVRALL